MVFVTVGTQKFPFDRLLKKIDDLAMRGVLQGEVVVQAGCTSYEPKACKVLTMIPEPDFLGLLAKCDLLITHGGVGVILKGLEFKKKMVVIPRRKAFGEHVDDHQMEVARRFEEMNCVACCYDIENLETILEQIEDKAFREMRITFRHTAAYIQSYLDELKG